MIHTISKNQATDYTRTQFFPFDVVQDSPYQIRQNYGDIEALANNIMENGLKLPVRIWLEPSETGLISVDGKLYAAYAEDGHRRRRAFDYILKNHPDHPILGKGLKVIITPKANPVERVLNQYTYNNTGLEYNALEELELFKMLLKYDYTKEDIARKTGRSLPHVYNVLSLDDYSSEVLDLIRNNKLSSTLAISLLRSANDEDSQAALEKQLLEAAKNNPKVTKSKLTGKDNRKKNNKAKKPSDVISGNITPDSYAASLSDSKLLDLIYDSMIIKHVDPTNNKMQHCLIPVAIIKALDKRTIDYLCDDEEDNEE